MNRMRFIIAAAAFAFTAVSSVHAQANVIYSYTAPGLDDVYPAYSFVYESPDFVSDIFLPASSLTSATSNIVSVEFLSGCPLIAGNDCDQIKVTLSTLIISPPVPDGAFHTYGTYSVGLFGTLTISPSTSAVPLRPSWPLMIAGLVGGAVLLRRWKPKATASA